jgi:hypothetical protein
VAYAIDGIELTDQPISRMVDYTLAIQEQGLQSVALGSFGWVRHSLELARSQRVRHCHPIDCLTRLSGEAAEQEGFLITKATAERGENESRWALQWQGYTATVPKEESMLELLPADGTVKCVDRLIDDSVGDCLHPDVSPPPRLVA